MTTASSTIRNPLRHDGLSRPDRFPPELNPAYAPIDDRDTADLLAFAWRLSAHLRFYEAAPHDGAPGSGGGGAVRESGTWQELLRFEPLFFLAVIATSDFTPFSERFEQTVEALDPAAGDPEWEKQCRRAFRSVGTVFTTVAGWAEILPRESRGYRDLTRYIARMAGQAESLLRIHRKAFPCSAWLWNRLREPLTAWPLDPGNFRPFTHDCTGVRDGIGADLRRLFAAVQQLFSAIVKNARTIIDAEMAGSHHAAHTGLFLAFLELFGHSREHLNALTGRHLDFYLAEILRLTPEARKPDQVHLLFEPAKGRTRHELPEGTAFKGGKDADGSERIYTLTENTVITPARVARLMNQFTAFKTDYGGNTSVRSHHASDTADSRAGSGEPLPETDPKWPAFGHAGYPPAPLGFAVAAPILRLAEGVRTITLDFTITGGTGLETAFPAVFAAATGSTVQLPDIFEARLSTDKGWLAVTPRVIFEKSAGRLQLEIALGMDDPAVIDYDAIALEEAPSLSTRFPVIRLQLRQADFPAALNALIPVQATQLEIRITVENLRSLVVQNDAGTLKPEKPFQPFGPMPRMGGAWYVGHAETFAKPLSEVRLAWDWVDPPDTLDSYFKAYTTAPFQFKADLEVRKDYGWDPLHTALPLSAEADPEAYGVLTAMPEKKLARVQESLANLGTLRQTDPEAALSTTGLTGDLALTDAERGALGTLTGQWRRNADLMGGKTVKGTIGGKTDSTDGAGKTDTPAFVNSLTLSFSDYPAAYGSPSFAGFTPTLGRGGIRVRLTAPDFLFGHKTYPKLHSQAVAASINDDSTLLNALNPPYTPVFENLRMGWDARQTFDLTGAPEDLDLIRLLPFGFAPMTGGPLLPDFPVEGRLFLGLTDLAPPQQLTLLFQFAEGSADPFIPFPESVVWSCLTGTGWRDLMPGEILSDTTRSCRQTGTITLSLPAEMVADHPELPPGFHWLRVSAAGNTLAVPEIIAISAQAGTAVYQESDAPAAHLTSALPAGSISKFRVRDPAIKSVTQPLASFGGRPPEDPPTFRLRSSERLRHKERAVTLWDYEHLVLDRFPEIHKVKCLNHTCPEAGPAPGHVTLVLIPDLRNRAARYPLQPAASPSLLEQVAELIKSRVSAQIQERIHVVNPLYEAIAVRGTAHLLPGYDPGIYEARLHEAITAGLTPWLQGVSDIHFGGRIHHSVILNLIEELPYVDYVTDFAIDQIVGPGDIRRGVAEAVATTDRSILVSHIRHTISGVTP